MSISSAYNAPRYGAYAPQFGGINATSKDVIKALTDRGFEWVRKNGSHDMYRGLHTVTGNQVTVSVPIHKGKTMGPGTVRDIAKAIGLHVDDFLGRN